MTNGADTHGTAPRSRPVRTAAACCSANNTLFFLRIFRSSCLVPIVLIARVLMARLRRKLIVAAIRARVDGRTPFPLEKVAEALYGWGLEREKERMRLASLPNPNDAINPEFQRTPPDKLQYYRPGRSWEEVEAEMKEAAAADAGRSHETEHSADTAAFSRSYSRSDGTRESIKNSSSEPKEPVSGSVVDRTGFDRWRGTQHNPRAQREREPSPGHHQKG
jgi:hypothetical protein